MLLFYFFVNVIVIQAVILANGPVFFLTFRTDASIIELHIINLMSTNLFHLITAWCRNIKQIDHLTTILA